MSTSFPTLDNNLPFQPCNFFPTLFLRKEKVWYYERPIKVGRPKYDSNTSLTPNVPLIQSLWLATILLLKNTDDFSKFMHCLDANAYNYKISIITLTSSLVARPKSKESFAKRRWEMLEALRHIFTPCSLSSNSAFVINEINHSAHRRNK